MSSLRAQPHIYIGDSGTNKLQSVLLDGAQLTDLVVGASFPVVPRVDTGGKIYWTSQAPAGVFRANIDGSAVEQLLTVPSGYARGLALDLENDHMYVTTFVGPLLRADLDGSNVVTLLANSRARAGIALDVANGKMYWSEASPSRILRADLDASNQEILIVPPFPAFEIELDLTAGKIYWASEGNADGGGGVMRANLDGSSIETLHSDAASQVFGLALVIESGHVYWADRAADEILRSSLDGSGLEVVISNSGFVNTLGLEIYAGVATPTYECFGFEPPLSGSPVTVRGPKRALPHKAEIYDGAFEVASFDLSSPPVLQVTYSSVLTGGSIDVTNDVLAIGQGDGGNQFTYTEDGVWQLNLKIVDLSAPGTYALEMVSGDETEYRIEPRCRVELVVD